MSATKSAVKKYAQIQNIDGFEYEFQPEHLFCEDCWNLVNLAFDVASSFGSSRASQFETDHSISVTRKS